VGVKGEDLKRERAGDIFNLPLTRIVQFKGAPMISTEGTKGLVPMTSEIFTPLMYKTFGHGISKASISDLRHVAENAAPDWSYTDRYICFGDKVWDMQKLDWDSHQLDFVYESRIAPNDNPDDIRAVQDYLLELAAGDEALARDYLQAMAPLVMYRKPIGIIWLIGNGANGKSAFLDAWYEILGDHFAEQSLDMIEDGRSAPALRGKLGNIVREASEKRIEDDKHYKNIGAHETFPIRILGTHETVTVDASFHTVINANNAPVFEDKSNGAVRRTLLVPFPATFEDDPTFKDRLFKPRFLGALLHLTLMEARNVRDHGYQWSEKTKEVQERYKSEANTAESFANSLVEMNSSDSATIRC
jgi:phage/plasmid-associated DNA primase